MSQIGKSEDGKKRVVIKPYKLYELADIYDVSKFVFKTMLRRYASKVGKREGHYYSPRQVVLIFDLLKLPSYVVIV